MRIFSGAKIRNKIVASSADRVLARACIAGAAITRRANFALCASRVIKSLAAVALTVIIAAPHLAQAQSAESSGSSEQLNDFLMGGVSVTTGTVMMEIGCGKSEATMVMLCVTGASGAAQGMVNIAQGFGRSSSTTPIASSTDAGTGSLGSSYDTGTLPSAVQSALDQAKAVGQQNGVDLTNPASVAAFTASKGGTDGASSADLSSLSPEVLGAINKAKADFISKFHISAVATEDGGGGSRGRNAGSGLESMNFNGFGNGERKPASIEGLQKTFGGEPIGVAGDNIFHQVSRRYQSKIKSTGFLPPMSLVTSAASGVNVKKYQYQSKALANKAVN